MIVFSFHKAKNFQLEYFICLIFVFRPPEGIKEKLTHLLTSISEKIFYKRTKGVYVCECIHIKELSNIRFQIVFLLNYMRLCGVYIILLTSTFFIKIRFPLFGQDDKCNGCWIYLAISG